MLTRLREFRAALMVMAGASVVGLFSSAPAKSMDIYKWSYRPLVVFAGRGDDAQLVRQRQIVAALRPAFIDRKIVVVTVAGDAVTSDLGPKASQSASALRQRYGVPAGEFRAVLIGKDGGVKLSSSRPIAAQTMFQTIDAMPMRQDEIRKK